MLVATGCRIMWPLCIALSKQVRWFINGALNQCHKVPWSSNRCVLSNRLNSVRLSRCRILDGNEFHRRGPVQLLWNTDCRRYVVLLSNSTHRRVGRAESVHADVSDELTGVWQSMYCRIDTGRPGQRPWIGLAVMSHCLHLECEFPCLVLRVWIACELEWTRCSAQTGMEWELLLHVNGRKLNYKTYYSITDLSHLLNSIMVISDEVNEQKTQTCAVNLCYINSNKKLSCRKETRHTAPQYLGPLDRVADLHRQRALRSASSSRLVVPTFRLFTVGSRTFNVSGPRIWNGLPEDVVSAPTLKASGVDLNPSFSNSRTRILSSNCTFDTTVVLVVMFIT